MHAKLLLSYEEETEKFFVRCAAYKAINEGGIKDYIPVLGRGKMEFKMEPQGDRKDKRYALDMLDQLRQIHEAAPMCMTKLNLTLDDYKFTHGNDNDELLRKVVNASRKQW